MCDLTPDHLEVFPDSTLAPSDARTFVREHVCPEHGTFALDALLLVTSELVTNSVLYGCPPITVRLSCLATEFRLEVSDTGTRIPDEQGTSGGLGMGLQIVAGIAREWGTTPLAVGKEIWCLVPSGMLPVRPRREPRLSDLKPGRITAPPAGPAPRR